MSNVIISYHWPYRTEKNISPTLCYYDGLRIGLQNAGHNVMEINHANFCYKYTPSQDPIYQGSVISYKNDVLNQKIKNFKPDLIIAFNHCITEQMYEITNCPVFTMDGDSPISNFWFNKDLMFKNLDRVSFCYSVNFHLDFYKNIFKVDEKKCHYLQLATSCYKKDIKFERDICFVGSIHSHCYDGVLKKYIEQSKSSNVVKKRLRNVIHKALKNDLYCAKEDLEKYFPDLSFETLFFYIAEVRRKNTLDLLMNDFSLEFFGWTGLEYYDPLYFYFNPKPVYSVEDNNNIYNSSKISLSITHAQSNSNIEGYSWRVCDIMATNSCFVGLYSKSLETHFGKWVNLPMFRNAYECYSVCQKLLTQENLRKDIVSASQLAIKEGKFTFDDRVKEIEQIFGLKKSNIAFANLRHEFLIDHNIVKNIKTIENNQSDADLINDFDQDDYFYKMNSLTKIVNRCRINLIRKIRNKPLMRIVKK